MRKLSPAVLESLKWLNQGNAVDICVTVGRSFGELSFFGPNPPVNMRPKLYSLIAYGFLDEIESTYFGIKWTRFTINRRGKDFLRRVENEKVS